MTVEIYSGTLSLRKTGISLALLGLGWLGLVISCAPGRIVFTPQSAQGFLQGLPDATYPMEITRTGQAPLRNGYYEEEVAPGSASRTRISLGDFQTPGDLNGDELPDAAVILIADPGGSGTFYYLSAVINRDGIPRPMATTLLGDRISIASLDIDNGEITVTLLTRRPDEPMATTPTLEIVRRYALQEQQLTSLP
ncbi:hypothetical protein ACFL6Q_06450 [Candidatus Neomarinimicrobiota bacterium]